MPEASVVKRLRRMALSAGAGDQMEPGARWSVEAAEVSTWTEPRSQMICRAAASAGGNVSGRRPSARLKTNGRACFSVQSNRSRTADPSAGGGGERSDCMTKYHKILIFVYMRNWVSCRAML